MRGIIDKDAENPYTPAQIIWPSSMKQKHQEYLTSELQRLVDLLGLTTGIYNVETCVGNNGKPYIMEVSPRGGGCKIAELQELAFGYNFIENEVRKAINMPLVELKQTKCNGYWCEFVIHASPGQQGLFEKLIIDSEIQNKHIKVIDLTAEKGFQVKPFTGANMSIGDMFLRFESREELDKIMEDTRNWMKIILK